VKGIASLYPISLRKTYLGSAATKSALKRESLSAYKKLHFATHALVDDDNPARSGIVLSMGL
jgi:CHAT domain-containing protein